MTTLTKERIAEIEADGMCTMEDDTAELCRLALLGKRVEESETGVIVGATMVDHPRPAWIVMSDKDAITFMPNKRVRLVVEDEEGTL